EGERQHVVGPRVDIDLGVVDAVLAGHEQPAHTVPAHAAERHRAGGASSLAMPEAISRASRQRVPQLPNANQSHSRTIGSSQNGHQSRQRSPKCPNGGRGHAGIPESAPGSKSVATKARNWPFSTITLSMMSMCSAPPTWPRLSIAALSRRE